MNNNKVVDVSGYVYSKNINLLNEISSISSDVNLLSGNVDILNQNNIISGQFNKNQNKIILSRFNNHNIEISGIAAINTYLTINNPSAYGEFFLNNNKVVDSNGYVYSKNINLLNQISSLTLNVKNNYDQLTGKIDQLSGQVINDLVYLNGHDILTGKFIQQKNKIVLIKNNEDQIEINGIVGGSSIVCGNYLSSVNPSGCGQFSMNRFKIVDTLGYVYSKNINLLNEISSISGYNIISGQFNKNQNKIILSRSDNNNIQISGIAAINTYLTINNPTGEGEFFLNNNKVVDSNGYVYSKNINLLNQLSNLTGVVKNNYNQLTGTIDQFSGHVIDDLDWLNENSILTGNFIKQESKIILTRNNNEIIEINGIVGGSGIISGNYLKSTNPSGNGNFLMNNYKIVDLNGYVYSKNINLLNEAIIISGQNIVSGWLNQNKIILKKNNQNIIEIPNIATADTYLTINNPSAYGEFFLNNNKVVDSNGYVYSKNINLLDEIFTLTGAVKNNYNQLTGKIDDLSGQVNLDLDQLNGHDILTGKFIKQQSKITLTKNNEDQIEITISGNYLGNNDPEGTGTLSIDNINARGFIKSEDQYLNARVYNGSASGGTYQANYLSGDFHNLTVNTATNLIITNLPIGAALIIRIIVQNNVNVKFGNNVIIISRAGTYYVSFGNPNGTIEMLGGVIKLS